MKQAVGVSGRQQPKSLFESINRTVTALGRRLLRRNILQPFSRPDEIFSRQALVKCKARYLFYGIKKSLDFVKEKGLLESSRDSTTT